MKRLLLVFLTLIAYSCSNTETPSSHIGVEGTNFIKGNVYTSSGAAATDAMVYLLQEDEVSLAKKMSNAVKLDSSSVDEIGAYSLAPKESGTYYVRIFESDTLLKEFKDIEFTSDDITLDDVVIIYRGAAITVDFDSSYLKLDENTNGVKDAFEDGNFDGIINLYDTNSNFYKNYIKGESVENPISSDAFREITIEATEFNGMQLLNGNWDGKDLQIGSNNSANDRLVTTINDMDSTSLGINSATLTSGISTKTASQDAMEALDSAIDSVNSQRSDIGSYVNRLEHSVANLKNSALNMQAAESQIRDVDVGNEMANFTKLQILSQAGTSMLSQANQTTQGAMSLFR